MRIGRTVQHASAVDTTQITALFSPCRTWRYRLTLPFSGRKGSMLTIFLKNPSSASEMTADKTVRTASEYVWRHFPQAGGLHVLNLYALRGTDSKEVGGTLRQQGEAYVIGPENDAVISQTLSTSQAVIIAWGGHAGIPPVFYDRRVEHCLGILDKSKSVIWRNERRGSEKYPFHACYWAYDDYLTLVRMP
ncbi:DUF1643 domain-containing protein [Acidithiobacillus ferriphilus]|uniref:DUF1643 domain-containing protein n=2 Tax=Acidithiobacillus TaxID=119977 RepID=A0A257TAR3_9PROT|nr:DUF1643 domain-containing protein [Acidithiobacillus ferriphilus]MBU2785454.1 DUF1643 domain-containing protein [Acidithiobacillus ferriphilus]MBU2846120.1 DUF1643 domain-containing protein [Acidithiobacillus ferriphilus]OYV82469.1 MAG: hypothetical protein B7Z70_02000 [Acidithiobacillus ferrivorans]UEP59105.1 DUF1643 domain-containing protein [Acidithiobacillus ferriphilus]